MSDPFEAQRRYALEALAALQRDYHKAAKPYIDMLARIEAMNTRPFFIDPAWLKTSEIPANLIPAGCTAVSQSGEDGCTAKGFYDPKDGVMHIQEVSQQALAQKIARDIVPPV